MIIQPVISENSGQEGSWIAFLCVFICLVGALLLPYNREEPQHDSIETYQVAITALTQQSLSMIADLRLADEEIRYLFQTNQTWPTVEQLERNWVAPFVKDKSWDHQGKHHWLQVMPGIYQSKTAKSGPHYLLNSQHNKLDIWIDLGQQTNLPNQDSLNPQTVLSEPLKASQLIQLGWTQVLFKSDKSDHEYSH